MRSAANWIWTKMIRIGNIDLNNRRLIEYAMAYCNTLTLVSFPSSTSSTIKNDGCLDIDCLRLPFTQWPVTSSASRGSRLQEALNWVNFDASEFLFGNHSRYQWWQGESRSTRSVSRFIVQRLAVQAILEDLKGWGRGVRGWWFLRMKVIFFSFLVAE